MEPTEDSTSVPFDHAAHSRRLMVFGIVTTIFGIVMFATAAPASRNIWVVLPAMGIGYIVFAVVHRAKANKIKSDGSGDAAGQ